MADKLTDRELWKEYWANYSFAPISGSPIYKKFMPTLQENHRFIEIGGFPGLNAAYFYRCGCKDVTLLDFYVDKMIVNRIEKQNNIPVDAIKIIEADFFTFQSDSLYNIVFSSGFIEHFSNTREVIERHCRLLVRGGALLIALPNFRGLNGLIQYLFDPENLKIHNLNCMNISLLKSIVKSLGLKDIRVEYTRKPMVWLEAKPGFANRLGRILTKAFSYFIKLFPIKCKFFSPYIIISARK